MRRVLPDTGSVTAEFAVVLPAVILVVALAVGAVGASAQSVRLADAAAVVARQTARGDVDSVPGTLAALAPGAVISGPAVIVEDETSTVIGGNFDARIDAHGYIELNRSNG